MTITIDKATLARIRQISGARGVSKFIAEAARERAGRDELLEYLAELDAKYGRVPPEMLAETDRDMRKIFGMPPPTEPWNPYAERSIVNAPTSKVHKARRRGSRVSSSSNHRKKRRR